MTHTNEMVVGGAVIAVLGLLLWLFTTLAGFGLFLLVVGVVAVVVGAALGRHPH